MNKDKFMSEDNVAGALDALEKRGSEAMNNLLNLNPRLEAARTSRLSEIHQGRVISDKALDLISESIRRLEPEIASHDDKESEDV